MILFSGLLDEAELLRPGADADEVVRRHCAQRASTAVATGRLVVADTALAATARLVPEGRLLPVSVVVSGGAGSVVALAGRVLPGLSVVAVEAALRDLDDLVGNAARLAAAAAQLADDVEIHVELPTAVAPGALSWGRAVEAVEAAGLLAKVDAREPAATLVSRWSTLVEADLGFKVTGLPIDRLPAALSAVDALVDGADPAAAASLLAEPVTAAAVTDWAEDRQNRVRRRLVRCDAVDPGRWLERVLAGRG